MRLLDVESLTFTEFLDDEKRPPYIAASHRWLANSEATFQDVRDCRNTSGEGYQKIKAFAEYMKSSISHVKWLWIDTCCINKDSAAELSEAINSMFRWYRNAELCLAYLADVERVGDDGSFEKSEWFERGWTLQELLAPRTVVFVTRGWQVIGYKGEPLCSDYQLSVDSDLEKIIARTTAIPEQVLHSYETSHGLSVDDKLKWMAGRKTTRKEDMSYALYGILGVALGANYGEEYDGARQRLLAAIRQRDNLATKEARIYRTITLWLSSPDPWTNHESARQQHEPETGAWLLQHSGYLAWKSGSVRTLWIYGKAGCGKTILCSTAIENIRMHCEDATNTGHAIFYFSFSDNHKQTYQNLLVSLVAQLGRKEPGLSMLRQAYEKVERKLPGLDELQKILLSSVASYDEVFLHLDALDECPEGDGMRQNVLNGIQQLLRQAPNVRILVTSRDVSDVRSLMEISGADLMPIIAQTISSDIRKYVSTQVSRDRKFSRLDLATKTMIEETLVQRADGMFRWVYCQLQQLKKSKSTQPSSLKAALFALPKTLDETYQRMLNNIDEDDRPYALKLIRWLAYAQSPPSLGELAEASIIDPMDDPAADGSVNIDDRGDWEDALEILADFVVIEGADEADMDDRISRSAGLDDVRGDLGVTYLSHDIEKDTRVRLAHFSVKEYLESSRILASDAKEFHFDSAKEHKFLTQSCLVYLMYYSSSSQKTSTKQDLTTFPLLEYAAKTWSYHALLQECSNSIPELSLLTSEVSKRDWLSVYDPDHSWKPPFGTDQIDIGQALYYASLLGFETAVQMLIDAGADINAQGGMYRNALHAASFGGLEKVVEMLIDAGADVNAQGGDCGNALQTASLRGHEKVVQMLMNAGADVNAQGGVYNNALQAASFGGNKEVVEMLMNAGADVNGKGGSYGNALQAASFRGHETVVQMLMDAGTDGNALGGHFGNALQAASFGGHEKVVQMLVDAGADVNAQGGHFGNALKAASARGHETVVRLLVAQGALYS
ncbi:hypothetical protein LTR95_006993 [Oleoguttula sp. CCFEE 5521]